MVIPEKLLGKKDVISDSSSSHESDLVRGDNQWENDLQSRSKDFGNTLVGSVAA